MVSGTGPLPAIQPEGPQPGWADLRDQSAAHLERAAALLDGYAQVALEVQAGVCSPDLARRVTLLTAAFREHRAQAELLGGELARLTYEDRLGAAASRQEAAAAFEAGRAAGRAETPARHRAPRQRDGAPWLRLAGGALAAGWAAVKLAGARIAAHKLATASIALAAVTVPVTAARMHALPDITGIIAPPAAAAPAGVGPVTAVPILSVPPSWPGRGKAPGGAALSRKSKRTAPATASPASTPAATPSPAGPPWLAVLNTGPVILLADPGEQVTDGDLWLLSGEGSVPWSLQAGNCALTVTGDQWAGTLMAGQPYDLELSLPADASPGTCTVVVSSPGQPDQPVTVSWGGG